MEAAVGGIAKALAKHGPDALFLFGLSVIAVVLTRSDASDLLTGLVVVVLAITYAWLRSTTERNRLKQAELDLRKMELEVGAPALKKAREAIEAQSGGQQSLPLPGGKVGTLDVESD